MSGCARSAPHWPSRSTATEPGRGPEGLLTSRSSPLHLAGNLKDSSGSKGTPTCGGLEMRGTIARIGVSGAGVLLAVGIVSAAPAGASNRHTEGPVAGVCTPSENVQGNSSSDPDGMSNGGTDKPGCPGGLDA